MIGGPHLAGAAEADQNFVGDEKRAGVCRDLAHRVDEVVGRDDVAGRALHRLDDDRRELALSVVLDDVAQMLGAGHAARRVLQIERAAVAVRHKANDACPAEMAPGGCDSRRPACR